LVLVTLVVAAVGSAAACGLSVTGSAEQGPDPGADGGTSGSSGSSSGDPSPDPFDGSFAEDSGPPILTDAAPNTSCSLGDAGVGLSCNGVCVDPNRDRMNCGKCATACEAAQACEGTCVNVATTLKAFRVQNPCTGGGLNGYCNCSSNVQTKEITLEGTAGKTYLLQVRMRGVVEQKGFTSSPTSGGATGTNAAFFIQSGNPRNDDWTQLQLDVTSPVGRFYLNSGESGHNYSDVFDYIAPIRALAGTKLVLRLDPFDGFQSPAENNQNQNITAPGLAFYNGELVQLDIVSVSAL
jgi:hypothetical protein